MVACINDFRLYLDRRTTDVRGDGQLVDVEAEFIQTTDAFIDPPPTALLEPLALGELTPERAIAVDDGLRDLDRIGGEGQETPGLQVHQLAGDVDPRDVEVMFALPVGELVADLPGLGIHQVCRVRTRIPAEQRVGQGHIAPPEAPQVESHQQHRQRVDKPLRGVRSQIMTEQVAIRQGEVKVAREKARVELFAVAGGTTTDDAKGLDAWLPDLLEKTQHVVLANGEIGPDLLDGDDVAGELDEAHDMA